jgi:hypothetical protein
MNITLRNDTVHIASIESLLMKEAQRWLVTNRKGNVVAINGLDGYCLPKLIDRFEYARKHPEIVF